MSLTRSDTVPKVPARLSSQAFWLVAARIAGFIFMLALPIIMVRVFDNRQFGIYKQVFVVVGTATIFTTFSFASSAFYYLPRLPDKQGAVVLNVMLFHTVTGIAAWALFAFWPGLLTLILGDAKLAQYAPLIGGIIATWGFSGFLESVATARADVGWSTVFIISAQISKTLILTATAALFRSVDAVLWGAFVQGLLESLALLWYAQKKIPGYWRHFDRKLAMDQVRYVAPFGFYGLLYQVQMDLHNYLVSNRFSSAEFAIYAIGTTQIPLVTILRDSLNSVILPRISRLQQENRRTEILDLTVRAWTKLSAAFLPLCALLLVEGRDFIASLYTERYLASWPIFALNLTLLLMAMFLTDAVIRAYADSRFFFLNLRIATVIIQIPASILAMNKFGMIGALMGVLFVTGIERVVSLGAVMRLLGFSFSDMARLGRLGGFAIASTLAGLATWAVRMSLPPVSHKIALVGCSALFCVFYAAAVILMKLPDDEEKELLNRYTMKFLKVRLLS